MMCFRDMTCCAGKDCERKQDCYRYRSYIDAGEKTTNQNDIPVMMADFDPANCDMFWKMHNENN